jgi:transposase-like protein
VQHQKGLSDDAFEQRYRDEEACRKAWFAWRWPEGFKCPRCAWTKYSEIQGRQLLQCRRCRYQTSLIAGTVLQGTKLPMRVWFRAMHLLGQGKKGISNIELGRRLGISTNAAWRLQHKLMQAMLERDRRYKLGAAGPRIEIDDAYIGGERTGEGSGRGRRGHTPFIVATPMTVGRYTLACRWCVGSGPVKPSAFAPVSRPEPRSSATAASGFAASPSSRVSSMSATSPAPIAGLRATLPSAGRTRCWPMSRTAFWPRIAWSALNICHVTLARSPGASTADLF